jgi:hypothetical protein
VKTWICDIDGTLAIMGDRSPFDWSRVGEDTPNDPVLRVVIALLEADYDVIFMSGRMDTADCRRQTELWLGVQIGQHFPVFCMKSCCSPLFMRAEGDYRPDSVVKRELYETHVKPYYDIVGVIDDRGSVVRMWRELGLTVLDVAGNEF